MWNSFITAIPHLTTLIFTPTKTTINMTWIPPSFPPQTYLAYHQCRRLCEQTLSPSVYSDSIVSPYILTGINPSIYCIVSLIGVYGSDHILVTGNATTLSSGKYNVSSHL